MTKYWTATLVLCFSLAALAQEAPRTIAGEMDAGLSYAERELMAAAEAMPDEKYNFVPSGGEFKDVRSFGDQLKHVAAYNHMLCNAIRGEKPPADANGGNGPANLTTKPQVMQYLKDSFANCHRAIKSITAQNALEVIKPEFRGPTTRLYLAQSAAAHSFDHYGQVVVYLRMNSLVPASTARRQQQSSAR